MNIHEYQAKEILRQYKVSVPAGIAAFSVEEAVKAAEELGGDRWVVKAQIHAGGRGKAGGVKVVDSLASLRSEAERMLGAVMVTHQTGPEGKEVRRLYVEETSSIARELYLSALVDRAQDCVVFIASSAGGVDIEQVAAETPEKIITVKINQAAGCLPYVGRRIGYELGLDPAQVKSFSAILMRLYRAFIDKDMSLLEINPLVVTDDGEVICLDAKINFDDNALARHKDVLELRDLAEEDEKEREASEFDLSYIALDGNIGCMVNGAGLAMATMDIIKLRGATPANFLDVGGGASKEKVAGAFKIITSDAKVKGILVNIFGGIMRCDIIAEGIIAAVKEVGLNVPLVVRLEGTKVEVGKRLLAESGLNVIAADDLDDAAQKIIQAVN